MKHNPAALDREETRIVFRKVSEAINRDDRYLALTPIPPCGRGLFHHLIFGSHVTPLPGLSAIGRAAMAEELGWPLEAFDAAFAEILGQRLAKADWQARVVWLPNALKHNLPQSPNVVKGWRRFWDRVPDCGLKVEAFEHMKGRLEAFGKPYAKAFEETCAKPSGKAFGKPSPEPIEKALGERKPSRKASAKPSAKAIANQGAERHLSGEDPSQPQANLGEVEALPRTRAPARGETGR